LSKLLLCPKAYILYRGKVWVSKFGSLPLLHLTGGKYCGLK